MTNEELDNSLINRINEVFTDMEHTGADEGWLLLREKYPPANNKKPAAWFWWGMAAALILVGLGTGIWITGNKYQPKNINTVKTDNTKSKRGLIQQSAPKTIIDSHILPLPQKVSDKTTGPNQSAASKKPAVKQTRTPAVSAEQDKTRLVTGNTTSQTDTKSKSAIENTNKQPISNQSPKVSGDNTLTDNHVQQKTDTTKTADNLIVKTTKPVKPKTSDSKKEVSAKAAQKLVFGIYASAYYNYSSGSISQFNLGAGTNLDIKLIGNLRLTTGIGIAKNTLNYNTQPPVQLPVNRLLTSSGSTSTTYPGGAIFKNYQADLFAVNVPISLKYQLLKQYSYISAGFVSGTYINEKYDETYGQSQVNSADIHNIIQKHFNSFDAFKTLNISAGIGYPVSKKNVLVVEPFLNAPLGGLGYNNLKFGSAGLNLKLNFEASKK